MDPLLSVKIVQEPATPPLLLKPSHLSLSKKVNNLFGPSFGENIAPLTTLPSLIQPEKFKDWRSSANPDISSKALEVDVSRVHLLESDVEKVKEQCLADYAAANAAFEHAIGDTVLNYVYPEGNPAKTTEGKGPLLQFSNELSQRYLDLYRAYVKYEMDNQIPMISNAAGQMKNYGFETEEIIAMQEDSVTIIRMLGNIEKEILKNPKYQDPKNEKLFNEEGKQLYNKLFGILFNKDERKSFLKANQESQDPLHPLVSQTISAYNKLGQIKLFDRAFLMMHTFAKMDVKDIEMQFYEIANMQIRPNAKEDERLLMEIRQRVRGEGSIQQRNVGSIGQNPLAYLNVIRKGEPNNPQGEFREQLYFSYMSNHFANTLMKKP